ncbi:MAG: hypothetical protein K2R98_12165 [Gemmataceae bacterium]|nr:hypothetical protein [Gemmataceae bacterium]
MRCLGRRKELSLSVVLAMVWSASGCMSCSRPQTPPAVQTHESCQAVPKCCRDHIHIFVVNGLTLVPHLYGSMKDIDRYVEGLGFERPPMACQYYKWDFIEQIRRIHGEDPQGHFVLIGYSIGGGVVHSIAHELVNDGIPIDLLVFIDPHSFCQNLDDRPANVRRLVNIISKGPCLGSCTRRCEANHCVDDTWHLTVPQNERTLKILADELAALVAQLNSPPVANATAEPVTPATHAAER